MMICAGLLGADMKMLITIGEAKFEANLADNETAREFADLLPLTLMMSEHGAKEKFANLNQRLPLNHSAPGRINAGDLMIYSADTLVLFYKSFEENFYKYTKVGSIKDASGLKEALGRGDAKVKFEIIK